MINLEAYSCRPTCSTCPRQENHGGEAGGGMGHTRLFITTLPSHGFLVEDVVDRRLMGEEPKTAIFAEEDVEEDPDRWCSYTQRGQELWQITCQW